MPVHRPKLILVSPKGSANVGGMARLMGNFELDDMRLVAPRCETFDRDARMMGLKNHEILKSAKTYDDLESAQSDLTWTVAVSMRPGASTSPFISLPELFSEPNYLPPVDQDWGFVFGREDNGLEAEELRRCSLEVFIPSSENRSSLNLVSAASIVLFHYYSKLMIEKNQPESMAMPRKQDEEVFFHSLAGLMDCIDFVKTGERERMVFEIRDLYRRARVGRRDLRILFGLIADLERKIGSSFRPKTLSEIRNKSYD